MTGSNTILVVGGTGKVGRYVVAGLDAQEASLRLATRRAGELESASRAVLFDWTKSATWGPALDGITVAYLVKPPGDHPAATLSEFLGQANALERVVLLSELLNEHRPASDEQRAAEIVIEKCSIGWTILRPNWFFQNFTGGSYTAGIMERDQVEVPSGGQPISFVDTRDVADVAVATLTQPGHEGEGYSITGPTAITMAEVAGLVARAADRPIQVVDPPLTAVRAAMEDAGTSGARIEFLINLCEDLHSGANAIVTDCVERVAGHPARSFATFAREHSSFWQEAR